MSPSAPQRARSTFSHTLSLSLDTRAGLARRILNISGECGLTKPPLIAWSLAKAHVDLDGIAFPILNAMVKSSQNPETLIV